jgi:predicted ATPase
VINGSITQGSGAGVTSAIAAYSSNGTSTGAGLDQTPRAIVSSTGTANGAVVPVKELAAIKATTPAATDYSDTITFIGAGYF